jgi:hypothetical protein
MDTYELYRLLEEFNPNLDIKRLDEDFLVVRVNEYLSFSAAEANEMLVLNNGPRSSYHWHMETEKMAGFIIEFLKGNFVVIERRSFFGKVIELPSNFKIVKKSKFEKIKYRYLGNKRIRIYSGNSIIQRAD